MVYLYQKCIFRLSIGLISILIVGSCSSGDQEAGQSIGSTRLSSYTVPSPSPNIDSDTANTRIPILLPTALSQKPFLKSNNSQIEYEIAVAEIYENIPKYITQI